MSQRKIIFDHSIDLAIKTIKSSSTSSDATRKGIAVKIQQQFQSGHWDNGVIVKLVKLIQQDEDAVSGIISHFKLPKDNSEHSIYFRDARDITLSAHKNIHHPYAIMGLQAILAARKLMELAGITDIDQRFRLQDVEVFYNRISENTETDCHEYDLALLIEHQILPELADALKLTTNEALARLQVAKDFVNFEYFPFTVATLTQHNDAHGTPVNVLQVDVPIYQLSPELKEEYQQRKQRAWYQLLPLWQQQMIDNYAEAIIEGRVIPTQLRKYLPGLRNAAEEKIFAIDNHKVDVIYHTYHSGNPGHFTKGDNEVLTGLVVDQLINEVDSDHLHLAALTSPMMKNDEAELNEQVDSAARARCNHVSSGLVPVNALRHVMKGKYESSWMIQEAEKIIKAALDSKSMTNHISGNAFWKQNIELLLSDKYKDNFYFKELINVTRALIKAKTGTDYNADKRADGNRHLEIACNEVLLTFYYEQCCNIFKNPNFKPFAINVFCKSGKDRTGLLDLIAVIYAVAKYCARDSDDDVLQQKIYDEVTNIITQARHVQRRAGEIGATLGAEGFVPSLEFALPKRFEDKILHDWILLRSAKFNKKFPSLQHYQPSDNQQKRLAVNCQEMLTSLQLSTNNPSADAAFIGLQIAKKAQKALDEGFVGEAEAPILADFLKSGKTLVEHKDPTSNEYAAELRRYTRTTKKVVGSHNLGKILGGSALCLLGLATIAVAIAFAVPSGGLSLPVGFAIGTALFAWGLGFTGALLTGIGLYVAIDGRKKGVAKYAEKILKSDRLTTSLAVN